MLTFIIVYFIIGLALELILEGKYMAKDVKKYGVFDAVAGTVVMSILTPVVFVYDMIHDATHQHTNKES